MARGINRYNPDYATPPGAILKERLEILGLSQAEFARRCGRSAKLISEIISAKAPLEPATALEFEKVLDLDASVWLGLESNYRLYLARRAEGQDAAAVAWSKSFPVRELVQRGWLQKPTSDADEVFKLLMFFGVGSVNAWTERFGRSRVTYRHSPSFESSDAALATWRRLGELEADGQDCEAYNASRFRRALRDVRGLTRNPVDAGLKEATNLCNQAGVALVVTPSLRKTALSGAAWWLSPRNAIIQLSARHKSDDHLWFTFFHEAAHILLHSKKDVFVDEDDTGDSDLEMEANEWASNILIHPEKWEQFTFHPHYTEQIVKEFADEQGIAPGIVVGRLQHENIIPWKKMNHLKTKVG